MTIEAIFSAVNDSLNKENICRRAKKYHKFPLKLGYSSFSDGINYLADEYRKAGLETEVVKFPADGRTVYADRHFPLMWDVDEAWAFADGENIADYTADTYSVVPFSADSAGEQTAQLQLLENLPASGDLSAFAALITHYPSMAEVQELISRNCKVFFTAVDTEPITPELADSRRWFNDLFGAGQIDHRDKCCCGFSITPACAGKLSDKCRNNEKITVRYLMKTRTYAGEVPAVTACIKGKSDRCFWITAHAYEPHATNNVAGVATSLEIAATLKKLIDTGKIPVLEYSIRFFHGLENFGLYAWGMQNIEKMQSSIGGVSIDSFGRAEAFGFREKFVLRRSLNIHPSNQHAVAEKALSLACRACGMDYEVREASKNNEDLMQDPLFGPAWNLLYGSLWEEPRETYPRCYFYHTSIDKPEMLSPRSLGCAGIFAAVLAYAAASGVVAPAELAEIALLDWQKITEKKCLEALAIKDEEFSLRQIRGQRLAVWRDLALKSAGKAIGDAALYDAFKTFANAKVSAALELLCGGNVPPLKSDDFKDVIIRTVPGPVGLGTADETVRELAFEAQGYRINEYWCFDDSGTNYYFFDGKRTVFEVALAVWATRSYPEYETKESFSAELNHYAKLAKAVVAAGIAKVKEPVTVTATELQEVLKSLGVRPGDTIMVHSGYKVFGGFESGPAGVIRALQDLITADGIVAMPAFSDCADGGTAGIFDVRNTPAEKWIGIIPEVFRTSADVVRSTHPTHSVCAWGNKAAGFITQKDPFDCFAPDGVWGKLARGGKIVFLGDVVGGNTFLHACEAWYNSYLDTVQTEVGGKMVNVTNFPGGCRGNWYRKGRSADYFKMLNELGIVKTASFGLSSVTVMDAGDVASAMQKIFAENPAILLHRSGCRDCAKKRGMIK